MQYTCQASLTHQLVIKEHSIEKNDYLSPATLGPRATSSPAGNLWAIPIENQLAGIYGRSNAIEESVGDHAR